MPNKDYIISTLNLVPDDIENFNIVRKGETFYSYITLKDRHPSCPICGSASRCKGFVDFTANDGHIEPPNPVAQSHFPVF